jgi:hypothetical protein
MANKLGRSRRRRGDAGATPAGRKACVREKESGASPSLDLPISDEAAITQTTIYPTIAAIFEEAIATKPWFSQYSPGTQQTLKYALYTGIAEALRTFAFRMNAEQSEKVFDDFSRELLTYDRELQALAREAERAGLELH